MSQASSSESRILRVPWAPNPPESQLSADQSRWVEPSVIIFRRGHERAEHRVQQEEESTVVGQNYELWSALQGLQLQVVVDVERDDVGSPEMVHKQSQTRQTTVRFHVGAPPNRAQSLQAPPVHLHDIICEGRNVEASSGTLRSEDHRSSAYRRF